MPPPDLLVPLKPCPFCGGDPKRDATPHGDGATAYFVACRSCACEGPWAKSPGMATRLWNDRI